MMKAQESQDIRLPAEEAGPAGSRACGDEFFSQKDLVPVLREAANRRLRQVWTEIGELERQNKWEDVLALFYPVEEKLPEIVHQGLDVDVRAKLAFALGQIRRYDDAMHELEICLASKPDDFHLHSSMAYTAYNSLYAGQNREIFLRGKIRADRIQLAHKHFDEANRLRPDGITNHYRKGMLLKQIQGKTEDALPLFEKAVANWDGLKAEEKEARHQEQKNFMKALYQLSSGQLAKKRAKAALATIKRCLLLDEKTDYVSRPYKYFALGKVHYHLNQFTEAKQALEFALTSNARQPHDFVCALLARTFLALKDADSALSAINRIPEKARRPYYRWTEADVLCALGDLHGATRVLKQTLERDNRARHKALIRLARIAYLNGNHPESTKYAEQADAFFQEKWQNVCEDALFWQALNSYRMGKRAEALRLAVKLQEKNPRYEKLDLLIQKLR